MEDRLEKWKKEVGEIPENTCPDIDKAIKEINNFEEAVKYLERNYNRYDTTEEIIKDLPSFGWTNDPVSILEDLRKDNEQLRNLGRFWYEKCEDLLIEIDNKEDWIKIHGFK